jgi:Ca-activated chloride channel family protein
VPRLVSAQYYFTGEVQGLHGDRLQRVSITVQSTGSVYKTGAEGDFEITSMQPSDSLTFIYEGYQQYTTAIRSADFLQVTLRMQTYPGAVKKEHLLSAAQGPSSVSFTGNGGGLSYHNVKRFLQMGYQVPSEAVKIEEMLGYFNTTYEAPDAEEQFHSTSTVLTCPWNNTHRLLLTNICGKKADMTRTPAGNLVLLIDVSGSMDMPNKLPLIKASIRSLVRNLRDCDTVSIVQYGGGMHVMAGIPGSQKDVIIAAIEQLQPDGPSPGEDGLRLAYRVAKHQFLPQGNNRIIFFTDGDIPNERAATTALIDYIGQQSEAGIHLTCIGLGASDIENSWLPYLAEKGKGHFAWIEDEQEGERQLLKELADNGTVADNMSVTADFDTALVSSYRLIGFENKPGALQDSGVQLQGCSVASGHSLMAVFEYIPRKDTIGTLARITINYCLPGRTAGQMISYDCPNKPVLFDRASLCQRRAACVALFGMKLKGAEDAGEISWSDLLRMTKTLFAGNNYIDREYLSLVARARKIYETKDDRSASHE